MDAKKPTIKDIAERAGVSRATVSRVLSNYPSVSPAKKEVVHRVIEDMSYRPSPIARGLATGSFPAIHVIISDICNPFYAEMMRGVEDGARGNGYAIVFGNTDDLPDREIEYLNFAKEHRFAGVIMISVVGRIKLKQALMELHRPTVLLNRFLPGFQANAVVANNEQGGYLATKYLIDLGHKKICHLSGLRESSASVGRLQGFVKAMRDARLEIPEGAIRNGDLRLKSGEAIGQRLVEEEVKYTAVFAANDHMAIGLMSAFAAKGIRVPEDVSIIGFDDIDYAHLPGIMLTTIRQPSYEMGRTAVKMLLEEIKGENSMCRTVIFETELVERKTCGVLKSSANKDLKTE